MGIEEKLPGGLLLTSVEALANYARKSSVWPATFGLACCAIEMMTTGGPMHDFARFGMERFSATPRQADLMIVAGRVTQKMAPVVRQIYDQMPEPKWVIAMGVCASSGGMFNNYSIVQGVDHIVPVDIYLPGCPPRPEMLLDAVLKLQYKILHEPINAKRAKQLAERNAELHVDMPSSVRRAGYTPFHKSWNPGKRKAGNDLRADWIKAKEEGREKQFMLEQDSPQKKLAAAEREQRALGAAPRKEVEGSS